MQRVYIFLLLILGFLGIVKIIKHAGVLFPALQYLTSILYKLILTAADCSPDSLNYIYISEYEI